jgi:hypothetical protein
MDAISLIFVVLILIFGVFILWLLGAFIEDIFEIKQISNFSKDFKEAVIHTQPSWEEIKDIASTRMLTQATIQNIIKKHFREILTGREKDLLPFKDLIQSYIVQYNKDEPFEDLPSEIRIHLQRLREHTKDNEHLLESLTSQIKDLLTINKKEKKHLKYYTIGGFFVGLVGFIFALYTTYIKPNNDFIKSKNTSIELQDKKNEKKE